MLVPKILIKNHSKSLYYCNGLSRNLRPNILNGINRTSTNDQPSNDCFNHQTLNE